MKDTMLFTGLALVGAMPINLLVAVLVQRKFAPIFAWN
jgi:hypothetical protein